MVTLYGKLRLRDPLPGPLHLLEELPQCQRHTRCPASYPDGKGSVGTSSQPGGLSGAGGVW